LKKISSTNAKYTAKMSCSDEITQIGRLVKQPKECVEKLSCLKLTTYVKNFTNAV